VGLIAPNLHALLTGSTSGYGGAELDMKHIAEALAQWDWKPVILTQTRDEVPLREWNGMPVRTVRPRASGADRSPVRVLALLSDLWYILRFVWALLWLPGRVWITKLAGLQSLLVMVVGRWRGIPVVFRLGHDGETDPDHVREVCFQGQGRLARAFLARLPGCAAVLAQTRVQADLLRRRLGIEATVIHNAHPVATIVPLPPDQRGGLLWVGRGDPIKRPGLMLDVMEGLAGSDLRMIMPPSGRHGDLSAEIAARAATMPAVTLIPGLPHGEVQAEFARARVFVMTSAGEGLPNVMLEALKHGTPIVSTVVNPDGLLTTGEPTAGGPAAPGWCVGEDPAALTRALGILMTDADLWAASSAAARQLALDEFDLAAIGEQYDELLYPLLSAAHR
jgi:glycosyltransferase involved in cell wall biosynthesis